MKAKPADLKRADLEKKEPHPEEPRVGAASRRAKLRH